MQSLHKLCNMVYWLGLAFWLSMLVLAGIAAPIVFVVLNDMEISIARYSEFVPDKLIFPDAHSNLAAGHVLEPIFWISNAVQFVVVPIVLLTLTAQLLVFKQRKRKASNIIRTASIVIASGLFAYHNFVVVPSMNHDLRSYWKSAKAGDIPAAMSHREGFLSLHLTAEIMLLSTLFLVVIATAASAVTMTPLTLKQSPPILQTPKLAENK